MENLVEFDQLYSTYVDRPYDFQLRVNVTDSKEETAEDQETEQFLRTTATFSKIVEEACKAIAAQGVCHRAAVAGMLAFASIHFLNCLQAAKKCNIPTPGAEQAIAVAIQVLQK